MIHKENVIPLLERWENVQDEQTDAKKFTDSLLNLLGAHATVRKDSNTLVRQRNDYFHSHFGIF